MNKLNLKNINLQAPYTVHEREDKQHEPSLFGCGLMMMLNEKPLAL